jgi:hypothetical protein
VTATIHVLEDHRARLMAEGEALLRADEEATGAQLVAIWRDRLSRHADPTEAALLWLAEAVDEALEADSYEDLREALMQVANGARSAAIVRARRVRR